MIIHQVSIKAKFIGLGARAIEKGRGYIDHRVGARLLLLLKQSGWTASGEAVAFRLMGKSIIHWGFVSNKRRGELCLLTVNLFVSVLFKIVVWWLLPHTWSWLTALNNSVNLRKINFERKQIVELMHVLFINICEFYLQNSSDIHVNIHVDLNPNNLCLSMSYNSCT